MRKIKGWSSECLEELKMLKDEDWNIADVIGDFSLGSPVLEHITDADLEMPNLSWNQVIRDILDYIEGKADIDEPLYYVHLVKEYAGSYLVKDMSDGQLFTSTWIEEGGYKTKFTSEDLSVIKDDTGIDYSQFAVPVDEVEK